MKTAIVIGFMGLILPVIGTENPCSLVSAAHASAALKATFSEGTAATSPQGDAVCAYRAGGGVMLSVSVQSKGGRAKFDRLKAAWTRQVPDQVESVAAR